MIKRDCRRWYGHKLPRFGRLSTMWVCGVKLGGREVSEAGFKPAVDGGYIALMESASRQARPAGLFALLAVHKPARASRSPVSIHP